MVGRVAGGELECPRLVDGSEVDREGVAGCDDAALARGAEPLVQLLHGGGKGGGSKRGAYQGASKFFNRLRLLHLSTSSVHGHLLRTCPCQEAESEVSTGARLSKGALAR